MSKLTYLSFSICKNGLTTRHFTTLPLVFLWNDVWETSAETPSWWCFTSQIWVVVRHQCGISALIFQMSFQGESNGGVTKCQLFSQASLLTTPKLAHVWWKLNPGQTRITGHKWSLTIIITLKMNWAILLKGSSHLFLLFFQVSYQQFKTDC